MAEWKKYDNTKDQHQEMYKAQHGFIVFYKDSGVSDIHLNLLPKNGDFSHYLICEPQEKRAHDEMRTRWELTGQPVKRKQSSGVWMDIISPAWDKSTEYSFSDPTPEKIMETEYFVVDETSRVINRGWMKNDSAIAHANNCHIVSGESREVKE